MALESTQEMNTFTQMVKVSLQKAQTQVANIRKTNTGLLISNIVFSSGATLIAGITAATGPIVGEGPDGWRLSCIVAAILAFVSTVSTGFVQQLKFEERLLNGHQCVSRLRELDVNIATGSYSWDEITKEYREIIKTYPDHVG